MNFVTLYYATQVRFKCVTNSPKAHALAPEAGLLKLSSSLAAALVVTKSTINYFLSILSHFVVLLNSNLYKLRLVRLAL